MSTEDQLRNQLGKSLLHFCGHIVAMHLWGMERVMTTKFRDLRKGELFRFYPHDNMPTGPWLEKFDECRFFYQGVLTPVTTIHKNVERFNDHFGPHGQPLH